MMVRTAGWRPVWAEVNLDHVAHNVRWLARRARPAALMAVVKADGYGHGAVPVARVALANGATWLGVATPEEGIALRRAGIEADVLVLGAFLPGQEEAYLDAGLQATLCHWPGAEALGRAGVARGRRVPVHVKVDTGMGRLGVLPAEAPDFIARVASHPGLELVGVYTHLATADEPDQTYALAQLKAFREVLAQCAARGVHVPLAHAANSAALLVLDGASFGLVRAGIAVYGLQPSRHVALTAKAPLRPALSLKARLASVKRLPAGHGVSYGCTYVTETDTNVGVVPLGYADGYSRRLSGRAQVLVRGRRCPVIGRICMDQCMVDLGDLEVQAGEEVVLIGRQGQEEITADEVAEWMDTISYEVVCHIGPRVPRVYTGQVASGG